MSISDIPGLILPRQVHFEDEAGVDYLPMPSAMSTYRAPLLPEAEDIDAYPKVLESIRVLATGFKQISATENFRLSLDHLNENERRLVDQFLGEGEVSIVVEGVSNWRIQESVLTGVWRAQQTGTAQQQASIEIGPVPACVLLKEAEEPRIEIEAESNAELMNARPLIAEIIERNHNYAQLKEIHVINLSLLPVNEADVRWLGDKLGYGGVTILSRGYGNCRITRTKLNNVWWVQYFNSMDTLILNTLEITDIPEVACAAQEDIDASQERLHVMLEEYA